MSVLSNGVFQEFLQCQAALEPAFRHLDPRLELFPVFFALLLVDPLMGQHLLDQLLACLSCFAPL